MYNDNGQFKTEKLNKYNLDSETTDEIVITVHDKNIYIANQDKIYMNGTSDMHIIHQLKKEKGEEECHISGKVTELRVIEVSK